MTPVAHAAARPQVCDEVWTGTHSRATWLFISGKDHKMESGQGKQALEVRNNAAHPA